MPRKAAGPRLTTLKGRNRWYIAWTDANRRTHTHATGVPIESGCRDPRKAPIAAQQALDAFIEAQNAPHPEITVGELLARRLADLKARLDPAGYAGPASRLPSYKYASEHKLIHTEIGHIAAEQLTKARLVRFGQRHGWRRKVGKAFREIRAAYRLAGLEPPALPDVPTRPPRDRFISQNEARRLIEAAASLHMRVFLTLAFLSGQRRGAILDLTWDRVDLDQGIIDFNDPDRPITDKRRAVVALDRRALALLRDAREVARTPYVIEYNDRRVMDVKKAWHHTSLRAGLYSTVTDVRGRAQKKPTYTVHHTKHSVVSWLAADGWDLDRIADFTNTSRETVKRVYRKVNPDAYRGLSATLGKGLYGDGKPLREVG